MTMTHVDTSTAVMNDAKAFGELGKKYDVLTILDGVCSVAGGLLAGINHTYFRVGHMGSTEIKEVETVLAAIKMELEK